MIRCGGQRFRDPQLRRLCEFSVKGWSWKGNDSASCSFNFFASDDVVRPPVRALDQDAGEEARDQVARRRLIENRDVVDGRKRGENFGAIVLRHERASGTFVATNAAIAVDCDHEQVAQRARFRQTPDVARMQEIEAAVRENYAAPIAFFARHEQNQFVLRNNFPH
jgi:hypothetical protein